MLTLMIWVCHTQHHVARQISQFAKSIHNSSPISLASLCRLLCYPTEDRCGSGALWDPDGTFPTIRFGLPLENDPFPVCDINVSSSASNEMTPPNENLKNKFPLCLFFSRFKLKANVLPFCGLWAMQQNHMHVNAFFKKMTENVICEWNSEHTNLWLCFQGNHQHTASLYNVCHLPKH